MVKWVSRESVSGYLLPVDPRVPNNFRVYLQEGSDYYEIPKLDEIYREGRRPSPERFHEIVKESWLGSALWPFLTGRKYFGSPFEWPWRDTLTKTYIKIDSRD